MFCCCLQLAYCVGADCRWSNSFLTNLSFLNLGGRGSLKGVRLPLSLRFSIKINPLVFLFLSALFFVFNVWLFIDLPLFRFASWVFFVLDFVSGGGGDWRLSEGGEKDGGCGFWRRFGSKGEKRRGGNQKVVIKKIAETGQKMRCGGKRRARANKAKAKRRGRKQREENLKTKNACSPRAP